MENREGVEDACYDKVAQASLNGIYVKAQELDRDHNSKAAPAVRPAGFSSEGSDIESHASDAVTHASDAEARVYDAETHASDAKAPGADDESHAGGAGAPDADAASHASDAESHASDAPAGA